MGGGVSLLDGIRVCVTLWGYLLVILGCRAYFPKLGVFCKFCQTCTQWVLSLKLFTSIVKGIVVNEGLYFSKVNPLPPTHTA